MRDLRGCLSILLTLAATLAQAADGRPVLKPPATGTLKVAMVISEGSTLIDFAGPWEVFENVLLDDQRHVQEAAPFELYTVAPVKTPIHVNDNHRVGFAITPDYDFATAPSPDIVVIGASIGGPGLFDWLKRMHAEHKVVLSVCTGAFKLARAGLLDGKSATTHHWHFNQFSEQFPGVRLVRDVRYVQSDPFLYTAGGALAGVDLALHIVQEYFGSAQAQATADRIEYQGTGWKTNQGTDVPAPILHEVWRGKVSPGAGVEVRLAVQGADLSATIESAELHLRATPATVALAGPTIRLVAGATDQPTALFVGTDNDADDTLTGTLTYDGTTRALTLVKDKHKDE
jgi:transcriptional regulator GlxA family with amidase domain